MDFGAVADPRGIDFTLPPIDEGAVARWPRDPGPLRLHTGAPMWGEKGWSGPFYPPGMPPRAWLAHYAQRVSAVEHNGTFYALPTPALVQGWVEATPATFQLCPKVPKTVSHAGPWREDAPRFGEAVRGLGERLGPALFQVPPEVGPEHLREIRARVAAVGVRAALEVRHPAFFRQGRLLPELAEWLAESGHVAVVTDTPGHREVAHGTLPNAALYLRFRATEGWPVDDARMAAWVERVAALVARGLREAWIFVHQHHPIGLLERLSTFREGLARRLGQPVPPPLLRPPEPNLFGRPASAR